jgi:hypothetical protein
MLSCPNLLLFIKRDLTDSLPQWRSVVFIVRKEQSFLYNLLETNANNLFFDIFNIKLH